ncbi:alpha-amylase [Antarcticibacterium flavum]|uniref:Alpha-amylase n=2 Tax=Antarcticibacterium flavum TaxID=2058175 RepID=A0A5B7WZN1_9FLAO|nr:MULTISPECIES: alpha-amylase [Antarcticibacterium]MCM4160199.1 alpha-amylase [Antarcticibacterium sp. W02-3]QCY68724.1 alpha-amylase [Antarcticibacterium flavum]
MKKRLLIFGAMISMGLGFNACSSDDPVDPNDDNPGQTPEVPETPAAPGALNLADYNNGSGIMMQAFYWDVEPRHQWWTTIDEKIAGWADAGVNRIWIPPASKGQSGGYSMGYDPSDYFDLGEYMQHGTLPTRFGTREELGDLINTAHANNIEVIADIVLNHNSGGGLEWNPYREKDTWTLFDEEHGNASGKFNRNYENFYPNSTSQYDDGSLFYEETNLDHNQEYVQNWLWKADYSVANYYKNEVGFDGWRFDYVLGFEPWVVKEWMDAVGGYAVAELWDGNPNVLEDYIEETGIAVFDFATFYKLDEALDRNDDLTILERHMVWQNYPEKAVTFTANHDTEKDPNEHNNISVENKMKAYAFILTHPGYPTIFYLDYENQNFQEDLKQLMLINNSLATGDVEILYVDNDEYVMKRSGDGTNPGLILYINNSSNTKRRNITTGWNNKKIMDYTYQTSYSPVTGDNGGVSIEAPGNSYSVYSIME